VPNLFYPFRPTAVGDLPKSYAIGESWSSSAKLNDQCVAKQEAALPGPSMKHYACKQPLFPIE
jgi:hypothetical protein